MRKYTLADETKQALDEFLKEKIEKHMSEKSSIYIRNLTDEMVSSLIYKINSEYEAEENKQVSQIIDQTTREVANNIWKCLLQEKVSLPPSFMNYTIELRGIYND